MTVIVETTMTSRYELDENKIFTLYADEWKEFVNSDSSPVTDEDKKDFITELCWELIPHFEDIGIEVWDDCEIDVELV